MTPAPRSAIGSYLKPSTQAMSVPSSVSVRPGLCKLNHQRLSSASHYAQKCGAGCNSVEQIKPFDKQHAAQHQVELLRQFFSAGVQSVTQIIIPKSGRIAAALQALKFSRFGPASFLPFPPKLFFHHTHFIGQTVDLMQTSRVA